MSPADFLLEPLAYDFFVRALVASALVGVACAVVGSFVVLKGMSFIGDTAPLFGTLSRFCININTLFSMVFRIALN